MHSAPAAGPRRPPLPNGIHAARGICKQLRVRA
ncbi:hypothetical protein J2X19_002634 [Rhodoferax ferrireducens]|uniref:Uncharacterized protein n=1 Tax=Rhodoferax ferrireducens TaxID=192843 RepID=A0ABU2C9F2_9BURK|nr:hypothetical protein [Rhodoferax ferrireducens]